MHCKHLIRVSLSMWIRTRGGGGGLNSACPSLRMTQNFPCQLVVIPGRLWLSSASIPRNIDFLLVVVKANLDNACCVVAGNCTVERPQLQSLGSSLSLDRQAAAVRPQPRTPGDPARSALQGRQVPVQQIRVPPGPGATLPSPHPADSPVRATHHHP